MAKYLLGVDIGATKSHALVADESGHALGLGIGGPGNHEEVGYDGLTRMIKTVTDQALRMAGISRRQLAGAGFGIAGYDWPAQAEPTRQAIEPLDLSAPYQFVNDTILGLLAGTAEGWGVAIVAGTSNNCRGRDRLGREGRVTGAGRRMGEYGGAGEMVDKALEAVGHAWTLRGPATRLTAAFLELVGAGSPEELFEGLVLGRYQISAAAAPLIFRVAEEGDEVAKGIIRWAGRELGETALGVVHQLGFEPVEFDMVLIGSLFKGNPLLMEKLGATVHTVAPRARLVRLDGPPVVGAVLLGMAQGGLDYTPIRHFLIESANSLLQRICGENASAQAGHG